MRILIVLGILILILVSPVIFLVAALEPNPAVEMHPPGDAKDAARTREIFREFRALTEVGSGQQAITITQADLNSVLAFVRRAVPSVRGRASVSQDFVTMDMAVQTPNLPGLPNGRWLNLRSSVAPSAHAIDLASISLGPFNLPAGLVLPAIGLMLDIGLGDNLGQIAVNSIDGVAIDGQTITLGVALTEADRKALAKRAKNQVRTAAGVSSAEEVRDYYLAVGSAVENGRLRAGGSLTPYLRFALRRAVEQAEPGAEAREVQSAILALAITCGHIKFQNVVGDVVPEHLEGRPTGCSKASLAGRGDLRAHFIISAGLEIASNSGMAFAIGEFKELLDSNKGGSGFSFDDLAADRAGIRFAHTLMRGGADIQGLVDRLKDERSLFPSIKGLPAGLSEREFVRQFGDVESAEYQKILGDIEGRIDHLAFYKK